MSSGIVEMLYVIFKKINMNGYMINVVNDASLALCFLLEIQSIRAETLWEVLGMCVL